METWTRPPQTDKETQNRERQQPADLTSKLRIQQAKWSGRPVLADATRSAIAANTTVRPLSRGADKVIAGQPLQAVDFYPGWRGSIIHESSPGRRGASVRLAEQCPKYFASQYFPDVTPGVVVDGVHSENLEALSFPDNSIDLHVTQDVFEHIFDPEKAFREIARTLRPGGAHIFTTPLVEKNGVTQRCASLIRGDIVHLRSPEYHGNPLSSDGSLVTMRWGYDICDRILEATGLFTSLIYVDALEFGIRAEYIEVLVTRKPKKERNLGQTSRARL